MGGWYRYRDVFQLMPARPPTNPPNVMMHDYPLILDLKYDPRIWTERSSTDDLWSRDAWERKRDERMNSVQGSVEQTETYHQISRERRQPAIVKELQVLLTVLTNYTFIDYGRYPNSWFITLINSEPIWGQVDYRSQELADKVGSFSVTSVDPVKVTSSAQYYRRTRNVFAEDIEFPSYLDELFTLYFSLDPRKKQAFYAACLLWVQANDPHMPPSMSLVTEVSAIETLVHWEDPDPETCRCGAFLGPDKCSVCGNTKHGLRRRFRDFITNYAGESNRTIANEMYDHRSSVAHRGDLLRDDLFDSGFNVGGKDEQMIFRITASKVTRIAIVRWFVSQNLE